MISENQQGRHCPEPGAWCGCRRAMVSGRPIRSTGARPATPSCRCCPTTRLHASLTLGGHPRAPDQASGLGVALLPAEQDV